MEEQFLKTSEAAKYLRVTRLTLYKYEEKGYITPYRPNGSIRRYDIRDLESFLQSKKSKYREDHVETRLTHVAYARVSSTKQKDDLQRQIEYLKEKFPGYEVKSDIGSGLNYKRRELIKILDRASSGEAISLAIAHKDRLCRFGFELVEHIIKFSGGEIIFPRSDVEKSDNQELAEDLLSIVQIFNCRQMGRRRYGCSKKRDETQIPELEDSDKAGESSSDESYESSID